MKKTEQEYLNRQLIDGVDYDITEDRIRIENVNTTWISIKRPEKIDKESVILMHKNICRTAKNKGIKISYKNKYKKFITENWQQYEKEFDHYNKIFNKIIPVAEQIKKRGIHIGCVDDDILNKMEILKSEFNKMFYGNTTISKMQDITFKIKELHSGINNFNEDSEITIYL